MKNPKDKIAEVDLALIDEPKAIIRMEISAEAILELAQSISEIGLLQRVLLRPDGDRYEIVFGHCRFLAYKELGLKKIKAVIRVMTDQEVAIARATENLSRVDLTPLEEAATYLDLRDNHGMTFVEIGAKVGKSPGLVKRRTDLLKMPPQLQKAVHNKQISIGVAEELWPITDVVTLDYYLSFALDGGCTVAVARSWCKDWRDAKRRHSSDIVEGGGQEVSPYEPRPSYVPCDICQAPVDLNLTKFFRACPGCFHAIKKAMEVSQ